MSNAAKRAEMNIREITECSICMNRFTDPRILPCIHTFCFECIRRAVETVQKKPEDKMPCPLCRKEFSIPKEGFVGLQRNFFLQNLMENLQEIQTTMRGNDPILKSRTQTKDEIKRIANAKSCIKHTQKPLDYYCADCKNIVCVSCFVESHASHKCKDVTTLDEEFRHVIENKSWKISTIMNDLFLMRNNKEKRKTDFLKEIVEKERAIVEKNQGLKDMIERHTTSLLDELSVIKAKHLKIMEIQIEEIERCCTILSSFEAYCNELTSKGSASDICSSIDQLIDRADELEKDHKAFIGRPRQSVEVTFRSPDLREVLKKFNKNLVGIIQASSETKTQFENCAIVMGLNDDLTITNDVIRINLHRSNETSTQEQIPTTMRNEAFAAVYCNTVYITGVGNNKDEIWKYIEISGWKKCASLVRGRRKHSAAFVDEVLYVCGGVLASNKRVLDSVESYNAVNDKCTTVGKLVHCVQASGNCVPLRNSLYIFGGLDKDKKALNDVQVYNTKQNTCTRLTKPMPFGYYLMRAVLCDKSVILVGCGTCFIYNIEAETWIERKQFKADVAHFGLVLENGRLFVIGGGICEKDKDGKDIWKYRDDVRYIPLQNILGDKTIEWKIHGKLPKPSFVYACANVRHLV